ncbi:hypothetical protein CEXT_597821 [Caerostris extrusa]|uniref:Uncharacterized protein n=1 Tax=Caerostris extrusa TaxID=172846 RepID=A0AAV4UBU3_CAEEX|nr:hypothetical protein CEXT_597821 [Caerostris extrusa]
MRKCGENEASNCGLDSPPCAPELPRCLLSLNPRHVVNPCCVILNSSSRSFATAVLQSSQDGCYLLTLGKRRCSKSVLRDFKFLQSVVNSQSCKGGWGEGASCCSKMRKCGQNEASNCGLDSPPLCSRDPKMAVMS